MKEYKIFVGTITYALKGRDILRKNGIKARVERMTSGVENHGCGYVILSEGNIEKYSAGSKNCRQNKTEQNK